MAARAGGPIGISCVVVIFENVEPCEKRPSELITTLLLTIESAIESRNRHNRLRRALIIPRIAPSPNRRAMMLVTLL
jgi:hypothetical protein